MEGLILKLLDTLLGGLLSKRRERRALLSEFEALKRRALYVGISNNLPIELHNLRTFLIEKGLAEHPNVGAFFSKWLTNFAAVAGVPALNAFSPEATRELQGELSELQL